MNAAVLATVIVGQLLWSWAAPYITPHQDPLRVVVVGTEAPVGHNEVASNTHP